jgi:hypothetical protein
MASMFKNIYDVEADINKMMSDTAISYGRLDANGYGPMTASTFGQGEMFGRALGGLLGGKDPRIEEAELQQQLMQKHPDPKTKEDLLAVAKDAGLMGLPDVQAQMLEIASQMPEPSLASGADLKSLTGILSLTQGSDKMVIDYLRKLNPEFDSQKEDAKNAAIREVRAEFNKIIGGYETFLGSKQLKKSDINSMMFDNTGRLKNISMFKSYLGALSLDETANPFAKHLFDMNTILLSQNSDTEESDNIDGNGLKVEKVINDMPDDTTFIESSYNASVDEVVVGRNDFNNLSKNAKKQANRNYKMEMMNKLNSVYVDLANIGGNFLNEENMSASELKQENQNDEIQDWITGGVPMLGTVYSEGMQYFLDKPPEELEKFIKNPEWYYRTVILKQPFTLDEERNMNILSPFPKDTSGEIISLWGISD